MWQVFKTYTNTAYKRERGSWERLKKKTMSAEAEGGGYLPRKGFSKAKEASYWSRRLGEQGRMTLYSTVEERASWASLSFSLQPVDVSCSCYTMSFCQKHEGL